MPYRSRRWNKRTQHTLCERFQAPPTPLWAWLVQQMLAHKLPSQRRLAQYIGVDHQSVRAWARGDLPDAHSCLKLANAFVVRLSLVYALANIPLRAQHEWRPEDLTMTTPMLATPAEDLVISWIQRQPFTLEERTRLCRKLGKSESLES
jgi:transcriptional regulator with XRE-family HTH domain